MDTDGIVRPLWQVLVALGGAAMIAVGPYIFPNHKLLLFVVGAGMVLVGCIAFAVDLIRSRKKASPHDTPSYGRSKTAQARSGGRIEIEESFSSADIFADAEEGASVAAKRVVHDPNRRPNEPPADN